MKLHVLSDIADHCGGLTCLHRLFKHICTIVLALYLCLNDVVIHDNLHLTDDGIFFLRKFENNVDTLFFTLFLLVLLVLRVESRWVHVFLSNGCLSNVMVDDDGDVNCVQWQEVDAKFVWVTRFAEHHPGLMSFESLVGFSRKSRLGHHSLRRFIFIIFFIIIFILRVIG